MDSSGCPFWIDPDNAFRLVVKCGKYVADGEYGLVEMAEQEHEVWLDRSSQYTIEKFHEDMASKIIWGPTQTLSIWVVDLDSGSEWKVRRDEHFQEMINGRWDERVAVIVLEVVQRGPSSDTVSSRASGVTNPVPSVVVPSEGIGDTCSSPDPLDQPIDPTVPIDWDSLTINPEPADDGFAAAIADEDRVYEAMGFKVADERAEEVAREAIPIPAMSAEIIREMGDAAVDVDDAVPEEPLGDWDRDNPDMVVGVCYPSIEEFRLALRQHAIVNEFEIDQEHSDRKRYRGLCASLGCPWRIRARTQHDGSVRIQINDRAHNCASRSRVVGKMASQAWVAERAIPLLKRKPSLGPKAVQEELQEKYRIQIPYQTVFYGRQRAANKLFGKWDDSFDWLYRFKAEVELRSPGSIVEIDTVNVDGEIHFSRFFCCFKAAVDGFRKGCRPYISIDSTHLNGLWNGQLPAAQALDGHNWMFPLAFGFFDTETKENWTWFMEQLSKAIGPMENIAVCTDACKGLFLSVKKVFPNCEQRECFRHLMENMKKQFSGDVYGKNMWPAARAYSPHKFKFFFDKVVQASPGVLQWLETHHKLLWARSKFSSEIKCDYINNNLAKCWNSWIKEYKDLPVHCLADAIREKTLTLFATRRRISQALSPGILPAVIYQLNAASKGLGHFKVTKSHPDEAEVTEVYKDEEVRRHVVYLSKHVCTCREWQVTGKPCPHALAVITTMRQPQMEKYVDKYYSVEKFQAAYQGIIPNITDRSQWPEVDKGFKLLPPVMKPREAGRQKKMRHLAPTERSGKATRQVKCPLCGEYGHRKGSYKCELTGTKKRTRTKKNPGKPGRKKAKKDLTTQPETFTPRTRAAVAREAALQAQREAEEAAAKAAAAYETAQAAQREILVVEPLEIELPTQPTPTRTRRNLSLQLQSVDQNVQVQAVNQSDGHLPPRKFTPKKKQLASKIKKPTAKE